MAAAYSLLSVPQQPGTEATGETFAQIVMQGRANRQKAEEDDTPADWRVVALTSSPGTSKTQIRTDALNTWLERKGAQELDQRFGPRLDRQSRTTERLERKVDALKCWDCSSGIS